MINNLLFYCPNKDTYPPFKNGLYLEEYFCKYITDNKIQTKRKYIPALWTNFQIEGWFKNKKNEMQSALNEWVKQNPSNDGYFTVVQYDDGPLLTLPENTIILGACSGNIPLPLIYEDRNNTLINMTKKSFQDKNILCSFVGNLTASNVLPNVRNIMYSTYSGNNKFKIINSGGWTPVVNKTLQQTFLETTIDSKFALAPRGYGRSSFRFFECFQLGTIPIYLWNDVEWLPFQHIIDYDRLCISIHVSKINKLQSMLEAITEEKYNEMFAYYEEVKHLFSLDGMTKQIIMAV